MGTSPLGALPSPVDPLPGRRSTLAVNGHSSALTIRAPGMTSRDALHWLAYLALPIVLVCSIRIRRDVPRRQILYLFLLFISSYTLSNLLDIVTFFLPSFQPPAVVKIASATVSWAAVLALVPLVPTAFALRSPEELEKEIALQSVLKRQLSEQLDVVLALNTELERKQEELAKTNARLTEQATVDGLTGMLNQRHFRELLASSFSFAKRQEQPLSILMIEVDGFENYRNALGQAAGDEVLSAIAALLRSKSRDYDMIARRGGAEFAVILPAAGSCSATLIADRLREAVERADWPLRPITVSIGVATTVPDSPEAFALIDEAGRALSESQRMGRNRVTHSKDAFSEPVRRPMVLA